MVVAVTNPFQKRLLDELRARQAKNPSYSLRAFSKFLKVPLTTLKCLLDGSRLPKDFTFESLAQRLQWPAAESEVLRKEIARQRVKPKSKQRKLVKRLKPSVELLENPLTLALRALGQLPNQPSDAGELSRRLGAPVGEVKKSLEILVRHRLVETDCDRLRTTSIDPFIVEDPAGELIRAYKIKMMSLAIAQAERGDGEAQNSIIFHVPTSKKSFRKFAKKLVEFRRAILNEFPEEEGEEISVAAFLVFPFRG